VRRLFVVSALLAVITVAWPWSLQMSTDKSVAYRTTPTQRGDFVTAATATGAVSALMQVEVGSQISGQVKEIYADFNSLVKQGEIIARIAPETYEAKVAQTEAELDIALAMVAAQRAEIQRSRAEVENARAGQDVANTETASAALAREEAMKDVARKKALISKSVITAKDWDDTKFAGRRAQTELETSQAQEIQQVWAIRAAEAALQSAEAQLQNNLAQVKQREAALRQARTELEHTFIRAPVTGVIVSRNVSRGQTVAASLAAPTLFTIAEDLAHMQVEASVVEADIGRIQVGQTATFTVDAFAGQIFSGEVTQIRKSPKIVQNVVTYVVVVSAENPDQLLFPGMTANLQILLAKKRDVLMVPNAALRFQPPDFPSDNMAGGLQTAWAEGVAGEGGIPGASGRVFVLAGDGQPIPVPVRVGATDGANTEVLSGPLKEGQPVIIGKIPSGSLDKAASPLFGFKLL
jgi:HlyD family secretion protein